MPDLDFPDPAVTNPWSDSNGTTWEHDGDGWMAIGGSGGGGLADIYQELPPAVADYAEGQGWVRTSDMTRFQLYEDADSKQWVSDKAVGVGKKGEDGADGIDGATNVINNNILLNGDFRVNQRNFDGDWDVLADGAYGYDGWFRSSAGQISQRVEAQNLVAGETYTLSWEGGTDAYCYDAANNLLQAGQSPLTFTMIDTGSVPNAAGFYVDISRTVPLTPSNVKLERGSIATPFEPRSIQQELALCQRTAIELVTTSAPNEIIAEGVTNVDDPRAAYFNIYFPNLRDFETINVLTDITKFRVSNLSTGGSAISFNLLNKSARSIRFEVIMAADHDVVPGSPVVLFSIDASAYFLIDNEME